MKTEGENVKILEWVTEFDTAKRLMIHSFACDIKMITNIETGTNFIVKGDKIIANGETVEIGTYEKRLMKIAEEAERLKAFEP